MRQANLTPPAGAAAVIPNPLPVSGTVAVSNLPATQPVSGTVGVNNFPATQPVSGTVAVTQSTSPWVENVSQWGGASSTGNTGVVTSGSPRVSLATDVPLPAGTNNLGKVAITDSAGNPLGSNSAALLVANTVPSLMQVTVGAALPAGTNNLGKVAITDSAGNSLGSNSTALLVAQTTAALLKTTSIIVGTGGLVIDASVGAAVAPVNGIAVLSVCNSTAPTVPAGQSVALQGDTNGTLFVKNCRRSGTIPLATTIASSTTATTVVAASSAGVFGDLSRLIISVVPLAAGLAPISFTATLSDGTKSYIFDLQADQLGTAILVSNPSPPLILHFDPFLPATTAATAWTVALSVATVTVHITAVAILQKAS